ALSQQDRMALASILQAVSTLLVSPSFSSHSEALNTLVASISPLLASTRVTIGQLVGPSKGGGKGKGRDSIGAPGGPAATLMAMGSGGANPPAGTATIPSATVGQVPTSSWATVVHASCKRQISHTSLPPVPPASAAPTRRHHPHRVVVALPDGVLVNLSQ